MITSIELKNWKTHKHTVLDFQKGVNVLVGVMGAGKSSVMDAISFALFGTFPALQHKRNNVDGIIASRPERASSAEVKLSFTIGDDEYTVLRTINRKSPSTATLEKNGKYLQAQPSKVTEEIVSLLKLDYDTFSRAVYAEQNRIDYFLGLVKGDRKKQIDQMLGLDTFSRAEENATSLINSIKSSIAGDVQTLNLLDAKTAKAQLTSLSAERKVLAEDQEKLSAQEKSLSEHVDGLTKQIAEMKIKYERRKSLSIEISQLDSKIATLRSEVQKLKLPETGEDILSNEEKSKKESKVRMEHELRELSALKDKATKQLSDCESEVRSDERKHKDKEKLEAQLNKRSSGAFDVRIKEANAEITNLVGLHAASKSKREETEKFLKELKEHKANCPICERELGDELRSKLLAEKENAIKSLTTEMSKAALRVSELRKALKDITEEQSEVRLCESKLEAYKNLNEESKSHAATMEKAKVEHASKVESFEKRSKELESVTTSLTEVSQKLEAFHRKKNYESEITKSSAQLSLKQSELKLITVDEKVLYATQEELTKSSSMRSDVSSKIAGNVKYLKGLDAQITEKAKQIANIESVAARIERMRSQSADMNKFKTALVDTESILRTRMVSSINGLMQNLWTEMYPYGDYAGIRLMAKSDDYVLEASAGVDDSNKKEWLPVDAIASGGERSMACLAMRIALSMVIVPNLKWLILDEPTHNIDDNGISKFVEVLGDSLPRVVEQVFIITHDGSLKQISSAKVYQLERDKDKHEPTNAIAL